MNGSNDLVISTQGLSKSYNRTEAVQGLELRVPQHTIFGFLGPNGAGKSTTIKLLLGLARPTGGSAVIFGLDSVRDSLAIRARVGYLAQDPRYYDYMSARETLRFAAQFFVHDGASRPPNWLETRIDETLELVGLHDKADRPIKGFSGGERQRLGIAQAQIHEPELLILDEPAAALDPMGRRDVLEIMERLRAHTTIFYSTHLLDDVQRVSDHVAILSHGRMVAQAPVEELLMGSSGTIYTLTLVGDVETTLVRLSAVPWISSVATTGETGERSGEISIEVSVTDRDAATWHLLPLVLAGGTTTVTAFGQKRHTLENIFLDLVEGGEHHAHT